MIRLDRNIRELLYTHECVIIPGLGGIISKYRPARIDTVVRRIEPPSRSISFNLQLHHNDGLLIDHVSRKEGTSYDSAKALVEEYVNRCMDQLSSGKKVSLPGVGEFIRNQDGTLIFTPDKSSNFLPSSYGFKPVAADPLVTEPVARRTYPPREDRKPMPQKQVTPAAVRLTLAIAVPLILFLTWGIIKPQSVQKIYTQSAGYVSDLSYLSGKVFTKDPRITVSHDNRTFIPAIKLRPKPGVTLPPPEAAFLKHGQIPPEKNTGPLYHIILGSYVKIEKALAYAEKLRGEGLQPRVIGSEEEGHIRVSYYSCADKGTALEKLSEARRFRNKSAWLLRH